MHPSQSERIYDRWPLTSSWWFYSPFKESVSLDAGVAEYAGSTLTDCEQSTSPLPRISFRDHLLSISLNPPSDSESRSCFEVKHPALFPVVLSKHRHQAPPSDFSVDRRYSNRAILRALIGSKAGRLGFASIRARATCNGRVLFQCRKPPSLKGTVNEQSRFRRYGDSIFEGDAAHCTHRITELKSSEIIA
jgi:hypothetical protein